MTRLKEAVGIQLALNLRVPHQYRHGSQVDLFGRQNSTICQST